MPSHFWGEISGNRGSASRGGTKDSGIDAHIRGWHNGVRVRGFVMQDNTDAFAIYSTNGLNGDDDDLKMIGFVKMVGGQVVFEKAKFQ